MQFVAVMSRTRLRERLMQLICQRKKRHVDELVDIGQMEYRTETPPGEPGRDEEGQRSQRPVVGGSSYCLLQHYFLRLYLIHTCRYSARHPFIAAYVWQCMMFTQASSALRHCFAIYRLIVIINENNFSISP